MFLQSLFPCFGAFIMSELLTALGTRPAAALISSWTIHLFTAGPSPIKPSTLPAAFTEATFVGYASVAATFPGGIVNLPSATGIGVLQNALFTCSAGTTPNNIAGYWIQDAASNFILGETFAAPVPIVLAGDFLDLTCIFGEPNIVQCG
jgi:hypothetical protein